MKEIIIEWFIEETFPKDNYALREKGYLMDSKSALLMTEEGAICMVNVIPTDDPDVFHEGSILIYLTDRLVNVNKITAREIMQKIHNKLSNMTAWEFVRDILCHSGQDLELNLI